MSKDARFMLFLVGLLAIFAPDIALAAGDFEVLDAAVNKVVGLITGNLMTAVTGVGGGLIALAGAAFGFRWVQRMFY
jgi:hypothetical protein